MHERARQPARALAETPAFAQAQRQRKKVEALFAELKNQIGPSRLRLRRMKFVREQFFLAATAQNLRRLVRFLNNETKPTLALASSLWWRSPPDISSVTFDQDVLCELPSLWGGG